MFLRQTLLRGLPPPALINLTLGEGVAYFNRDGEHRTFTKHLQWNISTSIYLLSPETRALFGRLKAVQQARIPCV